jgi:hypothetical protein
MREEAGQREGWIADVNEAIIARIREALDDDAFEQAWAEGGTLSVEEALDLARC